MKLNLYSNKILGSGIALLLLSFITIIIFFGYEYKKVNDTALRVAHTQEQLLHCEKIMSLVADIETGTRAYLITEQSIFLKPVERSQKEIFTEINLLKTLTIDNPAQKFRIDSLLFYADKRITLFKRIKASYEIFGVNAAREMAESGEGKLYSDHIRSLVDTIQREEDILQAAYKADNEKSIRNIDRILMLIIVVILLLSAVFIQKVIADNVEKGKAAAALKKMNDELEQRVADRTQALDKKEKLFRALVENNEGIILLIDEKLNVLFRSASTALITGRVFEENEKIAIAEYLHPEDRAKLSTLIATALASPAIAIQVSVRVRHLDGHYIWLEGVVKNMANEPAIGGIIINLRDISERKKAEQKIIKANRLYYFNSQVNQMIVRTKDENTLFREACQIAVGEGRFKMAWIGMIDDATKTVIPVMHAGDDSDYPFVMRLISVGDDAESRGPVGTALLQGKYIVCNDLENDERMMPWKKDALNRGYQSFMTLPIKNSGKIIGVFSFYTPVKEFFDAAEIALLEEATNDVSFALEIFEKERLRNKAEDAIVKAVERYDILARATSDTIWDWDIVNNTMHYNDGIAQMFGYSASEVENVVDWWNEKLYPDDFKKVTELIEEVFEKGLQKFHITYRFRCADGAYKYIFDRAYVLFDESGNPCRMIGAMQDITYHVDEELRISKAIIDAQEQERRFIGGELHDNVNQILAGSLLALSMVKSSKSLTKKTLEYVEMGKAHIFNAIEEVRKLSHKLAPASFDDTSLRDAFENLLQTFNVNNQFNIKFEMDDACNTVSGDVQINLYRIVQEQIKNIVKYAAADEIEISVKQSAQAIKMRINDNGKGFDIKTVKKGIGLSNIKKRVESFSGKFTVNAAAGKGCEIIIEIPLPGNSMQLPARRSKKKMNL
ncbi:PAS domain-containing protein [Ferruginibacter profundus]